MTDQNMDANSISIRVASSLVMCGLILGSFSQFPTYLYIQLRVIDLVSGRHCHSRESAQSQRGSPSGTTHRSINLRTLPAEPPQVAPRHTRQLNVVESRDQGVYPNRLSGCQNLQILCLDTKELVSVEPCDLHLFALRREFTWDVGVALVMAAPV